MPRFNNLESSVLALVVLGFSVTPVWAEPLLATPVLDAGGVRFELETEAGRWLLTVSGPDGYYLRQEFSGEPLKLSLLGDEGALPADGSYIWELRAATAEHATKAAVQSGHIKVRAGEILLPDESLPETAASAAQPSRATGSPSAPAIGTSDPPAALAPDHVGPFFIDGRLAFGLDIDGTESLGLTTLLVEDNNVSFKFTDTSDILSFATNDWQIKVNDTFNAGADYFVVGDLDASTTPFRIDAGAATDSIRIDQNGRVGLGTATPATTLHVVGDTTLDGDLSVLSSRSAKEGFSPVDSQAVLARHAELPVLEWSYRGDSAVRHLGPVAEDFHAAFLLGKNERSINPLDIAGVALAAVQGLHSELAVLVESADRNAATLQLLRDRDREIARLENDRDALSQRLENLEELVHELAERQSDVPATTG